MNWIHFLRMVVGGWWGWFLSDLVGHVGELGSNEIFTAIDAFVVVGLVLLIIIIGVVTMALLIKDEND